MTMTSEEFIKIIGDLGFSSYIQLPFKENLSVWQKEILPQLKFKQGLFLFADDIKDCNSWIDILEVINNKPQEKEDDNPIVTNPSENQVRAYDNEKTVLDFQKEKLREKLEKEKEELEKTLEKINNTSPAINIKRNWFGTINKDSIEKSLSDVYSSLVGYIVNCGDAIKSSNDNIATILILLQLMAKIESDLYGKLSNNEVATNEFREIMKDWCKQNGMREEAIDKLFETSFTRAYTLRDRINNLKNDIAVNTEEIFNIEQKLHSITNDIQKFIEKSKEELATSIANGKHDFNNLHNHTISELSTKITDFNKNAEALFNQKKIALESIENHISAIAKKFELDYYSKTKAAKEQLDTLINDAIATQTNINNQSKIEIQHSVESKLSEITEIKYSIKKWIFWGGATIVALCALITYFHVTYLQ